MLSKWLDVSMTLAAFHFQSSAYYNTKPPAFGSDPLAVATNPGWSDRPHALAPSFETTRAILEESDQGHSSWYSLFRSKRNKMNELERMQRATKKRDTKRGEFSVHATMPTAKSINYSEHGDTAIPIPSRFRDQKQLQIEENNKFQPPRLSKARASRSMQRSMKLSRNSAQKIKPSLFLQELAHLSSLLCAVALSTLRQDNEMAESPLVRGIMMYVYLFIHAYYGLLSPRTLFLTRNTFVRVSTPFCILIFFVQITFHRILKNTQTEYIPGQPWPPVDPTTASKGMLGDYGAESNLWRILYFVLGLSRSEKSRTIYNASRPFAVLGGVSDKGKV
jgi:hypothetical protein